MMTEEGLDRTAETRWHVFPDAESLTLAAHDFVADRARSAIAERGAFHIVLAGGGTPRALYQRLVDLPTDWSRWHIWFGDERCLPPDNPERNSHMAFGAWLEHVAIPPDHIHVPPAELGTPEAAIRYGQTLQGAGEFDLVLLGLGEDGHTASLFPGHDPGDKPDSPDALCVFDAPKPPPQRLSLSARRLSRSRAVLFLVTGAGKREAVAKWRNGVSIPAATIRPARGVDVFTETICIEEKKS
jgi:6-phosphogluconolactonase